MLYLTHAFTRCAMAVLMREQINRIDTSAAQNSQHRLWLPHFRREDWNTDAEGNFAPGAAMLHHKRVPPARLGYQAEGFLCGAGDRAPAHRPRRQPTAGATVEWVIPDAPLERMDLENIAGSHRSLQQRAAAGLEAAAQAAASKVVSSVPAGSRPAVAKQVAKVQQKAKAAATAQHTLAMENEPASASAMLAELKRLRAERAELQRLALLPPVCAERLERTLCLQEGLRAQTGFYSLDQFKSFVQQFKAYYPNGIKPLYRGLESLDPKMLEAEVEERLKKAPRVATEDLPFFAADNDSEWRVSGKQSANGKKKKVTAAVSKPKPKPAKQKRQQPRRQQQQQHKRQRQQQQVDVAGLQGGDTEWLNDVDINQLQQHMPRKSAL